MSRARLLLVLGVCALAGVVAATLGADALGADALGGAVSSARSSAGESSATPSVGVGAPRSEDGADADLRHRALRILARWDGRRASAYARGDVAALRSLYAPRSEAREADARVLAAYVARGLVVRGLRMQVHGVALLGSGPRRVRLQVRERLVGARALPVRRSREPASPGRRTAGRSLPDGAFTTRTVALRRTPRGWQVASVRPVR